MPLIEFVNPNPYSVHLTSQDKRTVVVGARQKIILSDWFSRYAPNFIRPVRSVDTNRPTLPVARLIHQPTVQPILHQPRQVQHSPRPSPPRAAEPKADYSNRVVKILQDRHVGPVHKGPVRHIIVGKTTFYSQQATQLFKSMLPTYRICLSNDIGIGILSYNRLHSLQRLLASISQNTDFQRTVVFVSDESSQPEVKQWLKTLDWIVLLENPERLGVAGNTNRLLQCLERFKYKIILNDDVEILNKGWEQFYPTALAATGLHHFCFRQMGVCGASQHGQTEQRVNARLIKTIQEKPQGAIIAFDDKAFQTVGYFDEAMGPYGMEHVDWSNRISLSGIQAPGFHDVDGSGSFFKIHHETSAVENRGTLLAKSREFFERVRAEKSRIYVNRSERAGVPSVSCIIPCRGFERQSPIDAVISCVKGQNFPAIEIILVEQDETEKITPKQFVKKMFVKAPPGQHFCKAAAFNKGVASTKFDILILQDADIIFHKDYFKKLISTLVPFDGCHIGRDLIYMDPTSTIEIGSTFKVTEQMKSNKVVGYFEGGSLACKKKAFFACGGFLEEFIGYGMEDCDFFARLKSGKFSDERSETFIHLFHGRTPGWETHHTANKKLYAQLKARHGNATGIITHCINKLRQTGYNDILVSYKI